MSDGAMTGEFQQKILHAISQAKTTSHACDAVRALLSASKPTAPSVEQDERVAFEAWLYGPHAEGWEGNRCDIAERHIAWLAWQARAASTSANVAQGAEAFPYQKTFDAIAAATSVSAGRVAISVIKFREAFGAAPPAQTALTDDVLMQAIADTAARGHVWASRALSNFRNSLREAGSR